jgi:hypothetical protein
MNPYQAQPHNSAPKILIKILAKVNLISYIPINYANGKMKKGITLKMKNKIAKNRKKVKLAKHKTQNIKHSPAFMGILQ